ncbi:hypothetical protein OIU79_018699 [Salix purpurea]|uniref:Uncharacterized protein n=1 Tax=Salix purpurea TaxID=77065 RepID=A0A9Q0WZC1_SALPP|nr:hypothetical protein OIU79_018699 [Salix purpurea]
MIRRNKVEERGRRSSLGMMDTYAIEEEVSVFIIKIRNEHSSSFSTPKLSVEVLHEPTTTILLTPPPNSSPDDVIPRQHTAKKIVGTSSRLDRTSFLSFYTVQPQKRKKKANMETRATDSKAVTKLQTTSSKIEKSSSGHLISLRGTHHLDGFIVAVNCDGHRGTGMEDAQIEEVV